VLIADVMRYPGAFENSCSIASFESKLSHCASKDFGKVHRYTTSTPKFLFFYSLGSANFEVGDNLNVPDWHHIDVGEGIRC
jgi:hypothetical protein